MQNNYEKLRKLCHENFIGSEKCGECDGKGFRYSDPVQIEETSSNCPTCKGKGYIIPLEDEECSEQWDNILRAVDNIDKGLNTEYQLYDVLCEYRDAIVNGLGKPLTLQMVLRLFRKISSQRIEYQDKDGVFTVFIYSKSNTFKPIIIDIDKDIKDQDESVLQDIIDIVK